MRPHPVMLGVALWLAACGGPAAVARKEPPASPAAATPAPAPAGMETARLLELARSGPTEKDFPGADAVVVLEEDHVSLRPDGTVVHRHHSVVRILDAQRGKEKFADVHIPYDTQRQTLDIGLARTANGEGGVKVASGDEISDVLPPNLQDATMYSGVRERVVSFPGVDKGSVVELEWTLTTRPTPDAALGGEATLGLWNPITARTVTITVPLGTTPRLHVEGTTLAPVETSDPAAGTRTYTFVEKNLPDRQPESGSPPDRAVLPRLLYSFLPDWNAVLARLSHRYLQALALDALPPAVKAQAARLAAGAQTDAERASAIFRFVAHDIRSVGLPLGWAGYVPNPPAVVLANRYGDARDKVGLLLALCAAQKIPGQPVLVPETGVPVIEAAPTVAQFSHLIARLSVAGQEVWVDPSDENGQMGVATTGQDDLALVLDAGGGALVRRQPLPAATSLSHVTQTVVLDENGNLDALYRFALGGWFAAQASASLRPLRGENLTRYFQGATAGLSASAVHLEHQVGDLFSVSDPLAITHHFSVSGYAPAQGKFRVLELPPITLGFAVSFPSTGITRRRYPLWVDTPRTIRRDIAVTIPARWKVAYAPPDLRESAGGVTITSTCRTAERTVTCHRELTFDRLQIGVDQYAGFRQAMTRLADYAQHVLLLTK